MKAFPPLPGQPSPRRHGQAQGPASSVLNRERFFLMRESCLGMATVIYWWQGGKPGTGRAAEEWDEAKKHD